jgi:hypothetical protein
MAGVIVNLKFCTSNKPYFILKAKHFKIRHAS